jgi:integrase
LARSVLSKPHGDHVTLVTNKSGGLPEKEVTFEETAADFLADYSARDVSDSTKYRYRFFLRDYLEWLEAGERPTEMAALQGKRGSTYLKEYLAYLRTERLSAAGTIATGYRSLKVFWNWCVRESTDEDGAATLPPHVRSSPCAFIASNETPRDRAQDDVGEPYSDAEVRRILDAFGPARSPELEVLRNRAIVHVLLASGVRRKVLAGLMVSDYNPDSGVIFVRRSTAKRTRREDDSRVTTLYGEAMREVNRYLRLLRARGMATGPLFPSLRGAPGPEPALGQHQPAADPGRPPSSGRLRQSESPP